MVESTNTVAAGTTATTNAPPKDLEWKASWEDWDGLHFLMTRQTLLGHQANGMTPGATVVDLFPPLALRQIGHCRVRSLTCFA